MITDAESEINDQYWDWNSSTHLSRREEARLAVELLCRASHQLRIVTYDEGNCELAQRFHSAWQTQLPEPFGLWRSSNNSPPRHGHSPRSVEDLLHAEIGALRLTNFEIYRLHIIFWPASTYEARFLDGCSDIKFFNFTVLKDTPHLVPVQLIEGVNEETHVLVKAGGVWQSLECFLLAIALPQPSNYDALYHFWCDTGKTFRLFDLPGEIRNNVYLHALFPTGSRHPRVLRPYRYHRIPKKAGEYHASLAPNVSLFRTSKQINAEACDILHKEAEFSFRKPEHCNDFIMRLPSQYLNNIRRISLSFNHMGFLRFFGAKLSAELYFDAAPAAELIRDSKLPLGWIALHLPKPCMIVNAKGDGPLWDEDLGCHKKVVDWILRFAEPFVGFLGKDGLYLGGCVKYSQIAEFAKKLKIRAEREKEQERYFKSLETGDDKDAEGGVSLIGFKKLAFVGEQGSVREGLRGQDGVGSEGVGEDVGLFHPDIVIPPICECATLCSLTEFTPVD